jgi:HK97 family phage major capsid protein
MNPHMASSLAASADVLLFGNLTKYIIRDTGKIRVRKLIERFAEFDQSGFIAFMSTDGGLQDAGTHPVKKLQMAAS